MIIDLDHFKARLLQDALTQATAQYWEARAATFEAAAPRIGEHHGNLTREQLNADWQRCMDTAEACRNHAALLRSQQAEISPEVLEVL